MPGTAVFPHPTKETTPLALRANVEFNHVLHEHVVLVSVPRRERARTCPLDERIEVDELVHTDDGIVHIAVRFGFQDEQDLPDMLRHAVGHERRARVRPGRRVRTSCPGCRSTAATGEGMAHVAQAAVHRAGAQRRQPGRRTSACPIDRTVVMGAHLEL